MTVYAAADTATPAPGASNPVVQAFFEGLASMGGEHCPPLTSYEGPIIQPKCFTRAEFLSWLGANEAIVGTRGKSQNACSDCTKTFAEEQRALGQCDGNYPRERVRSKSHGTSSGEHLERAEAQRLRRSEERARRGPNPQAEKMAQLWADPAYRADIMARRAKGKRSGRPKLNSGPCTVEGCAEEQATKRMCRPHYLQQLKGGSE